MRKSEMLRWPWFGDIVFVGAGLHRVKDGKSRRWQRIAWPAPQRAIFLGARTLANGTVEYHQDHCDDSGNLWFEPSEYLKGAWICRQGRNPEYVLLSDLVPA